MTNNQVIHLKAADGSTVVTLPAYRSLYDLPLNRYIDFLKAREPLDDQNSIEAGEVNVPRVMAAAVGALCGVDLPTVLQARFGDFEDSEGASKSLAGLYMWTINLLTTFTPRIRKVEDAVFEYQGEPWRIPVIGVQALAALPELPALETGEVIEAYEVQRIAQQTKELTGDQEGSVLFSYYLRLLAVLCRRDGGVDRLPVSDSDCDAYINERSVHFRAIDAGTALDVDFFLAGLMRPAEQTRAAVGSLSRPIFDLAVQIVKRHKQSGKPIPKRLPTQRKFSRKLVGGKSISSSLKGLGSPKPEKAR